MKYQTKFENFINNVYFKKEDPCIWIVYPPGASGDLLASILNFHYAQTGCQYFGINDFGQTMFRPTDGKLITLTYLKGNILNLNEHFITAVNEKIGEKNLSYSLLDQVIFSNHAYQDDHVAAILDFFPNAKIIRILPKNTFEQQIISWLSMYKHFQRAHPFNFSKSTAPLPVTYKLTHTRLLEVTFGDLFSQQTFEQLYDTLIKYLELEYKLIRFDFVEYYIDQQHKLIKPALKTINNY